MHKALTDMAFPIKVQLACALTARLKVRTLLSGAEGDQPQPLHYHPSQRFAMGWGGGLAECCAWFVDSPAHTPKSTLS